MVRPLYVFRVGVVLARAAYNISGVCTCGSPWIGGRYLDCDTLAFVLTLLSDLAAVERVTEMMIKIRIGIDVDFGQTKSTRT